MFRKDRPSKYVPNNIIFNKAPSNSFFVWNRHRLKSEKPGVYVFYDKEGMVVYVGKSDNLKGRVNSHLTGNGDKEYKYFYFCEVYELSYPELLSIELAWLGMMRPPLSKEVGIKNSYTISKKDNKLTQIELSAVEKSLKYKGMNPRHLAVLQTIIEQGLFDCLLEGDGENILNSYLEKVKWINLDKVKRNRIISNIKYALLNRLAYEELSLLEENIENVTHSTGNINMIINPNNSSYNGLEEYSKFVDTLSNLVK